MSRYIEYSTLELQILGTFAIKETLVNDRSKAKGEKNPLKYYKSLRETTFGQYEYIKLNAGWWI